MLSALTKFQSDILRIMQEDIISAFSELNKTELKVNKVGVTAALNSILADRRYTRLIDASAIPEPAVVYDEVGKQWKKIITDAERIFGAAQVRETVPNKEFVITAWTGTPYRTGAKIRKGTFNTWSDVERIGFPIFKESFEKVLISLMGEENFNNIEAWDRGGARGGKGRAGFNFVFSLSHTQSQKGLQAGAKLQKDTDLRGRQAGVEKKRAMKTGDAKAIATAAGKEAFYDLASTKMATLMPAVTLATIANKTKTVSINRAQPGGTTQRVTSRIPGNFHVILEFAEIEAQRLLGDRQQVDIQPIKDQWQEWAQEFADELTDMWKADPSQIWFLEGSDSRDEAYGNLVKETVIGELVKGGKSQLKLKRKRPAKKFNAKDRITKPKAGRKGTATKTTRKRAKTGAVGRPKLKKGQTGATPWRNRTGMNPVGLRQLIQKALPDAIARKMTGPPTLQYRTGRFANSANITHIVPMPQSVEIRYGYQDDPYYVFEPESGHPLSSRGRDPKELIGSSIREIAQLIMGNRFGLVRTKREL
tara:strand:+ start:600 stop:2201 length:1602 start_codon:yes stop_codon:yes gene_type:complete